MSFMRSNRFEWAGPVHGIGNSCWIRLPTIAATLARRESFSVTVILADRRRSVPMLTASEHFIATRGVRNSVGRVSR